MNDFDKNVFINCPFDAAYLPLLKVLLFTVKYCGFNPRIALERFDSGEVRLVKIKQLIEASRYSIHDLSRIKAKATGEYFRLNMPLELGIDIGCREYHGAGKYRKKRILILEPERFGVQKALSDMSFADCKCHWEKDVRLVACVREWFAELGIKRLRSPSYIWDRYNDFVSEVYEKKKEEGFKPSEIENIPIPEFIDWIDGKV